MSGKCIILSAPSGSGKTTLVRHLLAEVPGLKFSISATNRPPRDHEIDGRDYHFLSHDEFQTKVQEDAFLEWEQVYADQCYGTLHNEVERIWQAGHAVVFDVDVVGGVNLKKALGEKALAIFIKAPNIQALESRLRARGTEDEASLAKRLAKVEAEMTYEQQFDHTVVNDELGKAKRTLVALVSKFLQE